MLGKKKSFFLIYRKKKEKGNKGKKNKEKKSREREKRKWITQRKR